MAEIVTVRGRWDADEVFKAIEQAWAYHDALDELESIRKGTVVAPSALTRLLLDAYDLVQEVIQAEHEESGEDDTGTGDGITNVQQG